jgi:DNA-binding transcriptional LysR family regulator
MDFTFHELACLQAVVSEGSFQAAAAKLHRSHPAVYAAIKKLENRVGVALLDRSQYRVRLTEAGRAFHRHAAAVLAQAESLDALARQMAQGHEADLRVVIGDLSPVGTVLAPLKRFFQACPQTRLHLHFESLGGPWERLLEEEADLILHHVDKSDARFEWADWCKVTLVPVVAPGYLPFPRTRQITPEQMKRCVQVVIRDSARLSSRDYFLIQGAPSWTVPDQRTKKELIVRGMGWGHLPLHLVDKELRSGKLLSLEGVHFKRSSLDVVVARLRHKAVGPVAGALWQFLLGEGGSAVPNKSR